MAKQVVIVGSSGYVGSASIQALASDAFKTKVNVKAGVRDPEAEKAQSLKAGDNITLVKADMSEPATMEAAFAGADAVFVITPGHAERTQLTINGIEAAKKAGVPFVLVVSVPTTGTDSIFGRQIGPIEKHVKESGLAYSIIRLPFFLDNLWGSQGSIQSEKKIYAPAKPDVDYTPIATQDVGLAVAHILSDPDAHKNTTYTLTMKSVSYTTIAEAFSTVLGVKVDYVQIPYANAKEFFMGLGLPEWQTDGVLELFRYFDARSKLTNCPTDDFKNITGQEPLTVEQWLEPVKGAFA